MNTNVTSLISEANSDSNTCTMSSFLFSYCMNGFEINTCTRRKINMERENCTNYSIDHWTK